MSITVTRKGDGIKDVLSALERLTKKQVLVGIPQAAGMHDMPPDAKGNKPPPTISNAQIGYLMETGMPAQNVPARPFLVPGVLSGYDRITIYLQKATHAAIDGDSSRVLIYLKSAGKTAASSVKTYIRAGDFTPLADSTLRNRIYKKQGKKGARLELQSRASGQAAGIQFAKPLINTGQLRNSVTYVLKTI